jgi:Sigma-70, region 4
LTPERRAAVIEARRENPTGTQEEIARVAGVSRATVSRSSAPVVAALLNSAPSRKSGNLLVVGLELRDHALRQR